MLAVPIDDFISDERMLGPWFAGDSWSAWRLTLRAAFGHGHEFTPRERYRFFELADRSPPTQRVKELWCLVGRRGGKDSAASAIAAYCAALGEYKKYLRPGEKATVLCLACTREQAKICYSYIASYFEEVPLLRPLVKYTSPTDGYLECGTRSK